MKTKKQGSVGVQNRVAGEPGEEPGREYVLKEEGGKGGWDEDERSMR